MTPPEERILEQYFEDLRSADRREASPFEVTVAAAGRRAHASRLRTQPMPVIAAMVLSLCAISIGLLRLRPAPPAPPSQPVSLAVWSSPTAFLLETPGKKFLNTTPRIGVEPLPSPNPGKDRPK